MVKGGWEPGFSNTMKGEIQSIRRCSHTTFSSEEAASSSLLSRLVPTRRELRHGCLQPLMCSPYPRYLGWHYSLWSLLKVALDHYHLKQHVALHRKRKAVDAQPARWRPLIIIAVYTSNWKRKALGPMFLQQMILELSEFTSEN